MVLNPEHYLMHYGFLVSMSIISLITLLLLVSCLTWNNSFELLITDNSLMCATLISQDSAAMWCIGFQKVERGFTILGG